MIPAAWELGGPSRFVKQVTRALHEGASAVVQLPTHVPAGLAWALRSGIEDLDCLRWREVSVDDLDFSSFVKLVASLQQHCLAGSNASDGEVETLARSLSHSVLHLEIRHPEQWPMLRTLLERFRGVASQFEPNSCGAICLSLPASLRACPPDAGLQIFQWREIVEPLDTWRLADEHLPRNGCGTLERSLACSLIVEIAAYDLNLALELTRLSLRELCDPLVWLQQRNRTRRADKSPPAWDQGTADDWRGGFMPHSVWVATEGDQSEISRRVWQGQLAVLFPYLERCRVRMLPIWSRCLKLPLISECGIVNDPADLELGQLAHFLRNQLPAQQWQCLAKLRDWRHELAHLRPIRDVDFALLPKEL